ncbi:MAG: PQQ-binding-like beta-propeller repeat protein [Planctomycetota bacterium]|nr:PQQ-binding-like beta-propeller repeat protein [Planctomycetota bacterium]
MTKAANPHQASNHFPRAGGPNPRAGGPSPRRTGPAAASLAALLALAMALPGCGGSRPTGSTGPSYTTAPATTAPATTAAGRQRLSTADLIEQRRAAFTIDHDVYTKLGYRLDWRGFPVVRQGERIDFLDVYDDVVVAHESGATVSVLEADTGALRNSSQVANPITRFVGNVRVGNHMVVSSDNELFAFDLDTGALTARHSLNHVVTTHPVHAAGQMIYGSAVGHVYARRLNPPVDAWAFDLGGPIDTDPVLAGPIVAAVSRNGDIAMLDAATGTLVGRAKIYGGCDAAPVAGDGAVFFASLDQSIYAFNLDGALRWRVRTEHPLRITPTLHAGVLYVPTADKGLRAIDANTGIELWHQPDARGRVVGVRNGRLLTWDGNQAAAATGPTGVATTLDPDTGDVIFSAELPGVAMLKPDRFVDGNLYAVSRGGIVAKFQARD